ncbi:MAG: hypothetical protein ACI9TY_001738 [Alphaproteobacteria bacterium]|jgi:hypothetical protein
MGLNDIAKGSSGTFGRNMIAAAGFVGLVSSMGNAFAAQQYVHQQGLEADKDAVQIVAMPDHKSPEALLQDSIRKVQSTTSLQSSPQMVNYILESTQNREERVRQVMNEFKTKFQQNRSEDSMDIAFINSEDIEFHRNITPDDISEQYDTLQRDAFTEEYLSKGHNHEDSVEMAKEAQEKILKNVLSPKVVARSNAEDMEAHNKEYNLALGMHDGSSFSLASLPKDKKMHNSANQYKEEGLNSAGIVQIKNDSTMKIYKSYYSEMTEDVGSLEIQGYSFEENLKCTIDHEVGHNLNTDHNDAYMNQNANEALADLNCLAQNAAENNGKLSQELVDRIIIERSYGAMGGAKGGDMEHYGVPVIKEFVKNEDFNAFVGQTYDEVSSTIVESQAQYLDLSEVDLSSRDSQTGEHIGVKKVKIVGIDIDENADFNARFKEVLAQAIAYHKLDPEFFETLSPRMLRDYMDNNELPEMLDVEQQLFTDIADRAYLIKTAEDKMLGLDKIEYEMPNNTRNAEAEYNHSMSSIEEIPQEMMATYHYDTSPEAVAEMTGNELTVATYANELASIWRDEDNLEMHDYSLDEISHKLNQHERMTQSTTFELPEGLTVSDIESIHGSHKMALEFSQSQEITYGDHKHTPKQELDNEDLTRM